MILNSKNTTISYRCPYCGKNILSVVGVFSLSGDMIKLKCDCGESELVITRTKDGKVRINVPCLICPKPHNYVIGTDTFFGNGVFALPCSVTGLNICFIGEKDDVLGAIKESDEELCELMKEAGIESFEAFRNQEEDDCDFDDCHSHKDDDEAIEPIDSYVDDIMRFLLLDLTDSGDIHCNCTEEQAPVYSYEFRENGVRVFCKTCGAEAFLPVTNSTSAEAVLNCTHLDLK